MRFLISFFMLLAVMPSYAAPVLVTETVGQASEYVVTSREVQICMTIERILFPAKGSSGLYEVRPGEPEFRNAATSVLLEIVIALEAESFAVTAPAEKEVSDALAKIERATSGKAYWNHLEVSDVELKKFTARKFLAKNFLKSKTSAMTAIITDQEAQVYYEKNRLKFGTLPFDDFKENIKTYLSQQQLEERLRSWFEVLKRKYKVRNFVSDSQ